MQNGWVHLLLVNHSEEKVAVYYNALPSPFLLPKIGPRPPYYAYPRYEPYYTKI